ncbi:Hypothetical predicted protein [Mytilus galloprovincialis]|uniref:Uncharacterized protein n=1 Tax=Mytilus galloprovincialis TaxID=29158 RepID=A0A8B6F8P2_MYTGA|nr:Hypothetical predicted protein [Mytilus galloprovincialis]
MPGGSNTLNKTSTKPTHSKTVRSVQTLLAAKKDNKDEKEPKAKRTHSEVSNDSNTSLDLSGLINFQKDLDEIKFSLRDVTTKEHLIDVTKDLVKTSDLENLVTGIVKKLFSKFESSLEKKLNDKITKIEKEMEEKAEALSIENEHLKKRLDAMSSHITPIKTDLAETAKVAKIANLSSNYNEQYSRKNNIKVFNFPRRDRQNLRKDFIEMVKKDLDVSLEERDVVAIHRLPAVHEPSPLIVRFFNSDVKRSVMRVRKQLNGKVKFVDDVTQRNMELIHRLEKSNHFEQVWYFNCGVYGRTECGEQIKFGMYDDINFRLRQFRSGR